MRRVVRVLAGMLGAILPLLVGGCATTVVQTHPLIETAPDAATAKVYFIRPFTYRERGAADNPVKIEVNNAPLLELGKGEYTLLHLKPSAITVTTRNFTRFTNKNDLVEMTRSIELDLKPGNTYFLHIRQVNEEFRGVYYLIQPVDQNTAKGLVLDLHPSGAARSARITDLPD
jgi:hypothetical protein